MAVITIRVPDDRKKELSEAIHKLVYMDDKERRKIIQALEGNQGKRIDEIRKLLRADDIPRSNKTLINYCIRCGIPYII